MRTVEIPKIVGAALLSLVVLGGCMTSPWPGHSIKYAGIYQEGFEVDAFEPCRYEDESWWVVGGERLHARYREAVTRPYGRVYVVVRGRVSELGEHGHLGEYDREFHVEELIEIHPGVTSCEAARGL